jgi:hypothetical protein
MHRVRILGTAVAVSTLILTAANGQSVWDKKPYTQWTMSEVLQVLSNSPWTQVQIENVRVSGLFNSYAATIRLRSALPIRQALLRKKQLQLNYDKFTPADKNRFDNETREFLSCSDCEKFYLVTLGSPIFSPAAVPNSEPSVVFDIVGELKNLSPAELKRHVFLVNDQGDRRELIHFVPPSAEGKEAMFVFPRLDKQASHLSPPVTKSFISSLMKNSLMSALFH